MMGMDIEVKGTYLEEDKKRIPDAALDTAISRTFDEIYYVNLTRQEIVTSKVTSVYPVPAAQHDPGFVQQFIESLHPDEREIFKGKFNFHRLEEAFGAGAGRICQEGRRLGKDGRYHWISLEAVRVQDNDAGDKMAVFLISTIDARKHLETETEIMMSGILAMFGELIILDLKTGQYVVRKGDTSTQAALQFCTPAHFAEDNKKYGELLIHPEDREKFFDFFNLERMRESIAAGKRKFIAEVRRKNGSGEYRWCEMIGTVAENKLFDDYSVLLTFRDIHELRVAQQEKREALAKALEAARQANQSKSDFLSRMSHDTRTPMNAIIGMSNIAAANWNNPEKLRDSLKKIDISAKFLMALINDVLDMSKIESGKMEVMKVDFDLRAMLQEIRVVCQEQANEKEQELQMKVEEGVGQYYTGDSLRIHQILINLLGNAVKYTPNRGRITFLAEEGNKEGQNTLCFTVRDNGMGMSKEFLEKIFQPFEQERKGGGRIFEGTGLGLTIANELVKLMGGQISVASELGRGSEFKVCLPLRRAAGSSKSAEPGKTADPGKTAELGKTAEPGKTADPGKTTDPGKSAGPGKPAEPGKDGQKAARSRFLFNKERVLLVEDNDLNREIARTMLEIRNIRVEEAVDGQEALDMYLASEQGYYDAVLMDIRMPVMDGLEACRRIRRSERPDAVTIPIIAMTANAFRDEQEEAERAGMTDYLTKPVKPEELYSALEHQWKQYQ